MGLDVSLHHAENGAINDDDTAIEQPSKIYPEHLFKVGYLRSSYNSSGINHVMESMGLMTLYEMFDVPRGEYRFKPAWDVCLGRVKTTLLKFREMAQLPLNRMRAEFISDRPLRDDVPIHKDERSALEYVKQELKEHEGHDYKSWRSANGHFWQDKPFPVRAIVFGCQFNVNNTGHWIVYDVDEEFIDWYEQALLITQETCEFVLAQKDPQNYYFCWSA